jgi:hypothetical protein
VRRLINIEEVGRFERGVGPGVALVGEEWQRGFGGGFIFGWSAG